MLFIIAVLAFLSAAFLLFRFTRRQDPQISNSPAILDLPPPNARPLFAPSDEDLRRETDEIDARDIARRELAARAASRSAVDHALSEWRTKPNAASAAELLRVTAENGLDGDFSHAAHEILDLFHTSGIAGLTSDDLAMLLDSHARLLSFEERGSGSMFWLKQEVAGLRACSDQR
jgi:hypothetical protein